MIILNRFLTCPLVLQEARPVYRERGDLRLHQNGTGRGSIRATLYLWIEQLWTDGTYRPLITAHYRHDAVFSPALTTLRSWRLPRAKQVIFLIQRMEHKHMLRSGRQPCII